MKNLRSSQYGKFTASFAENVMNFEGSRHILTLSNKKDTVKLVVPDFLVPDARKAMKRGGGDRILDGIAKDCIVFDVAYKAHKPKKIRKTRRATGAI